MTTSSMTIQTPKNFSFWRTVYSHGWCSLSPFSVDKGTKMLARPFTVPNQANVQCRILAKNSHIVVHTESQRPLSPKQRLNLRSQIQACLRLDEDFSEFYVEARKHRQFRWIPPMRVGRLLRAPTVFEDVVKMMCTTNCSWALTETMVGNLTEKLGTRLGPSTYGFPSPEVIAGMSDSFLRKEIRSGYRSPYLLELAELVAAHKLDIECWRRSNLPTDELYDQVVAIKGIGAYAAGNILKLLGRYDYLGLDSWVRKQFSAIHRHGRKTRDSVIERHYKPFGKWKGLFFWLEMTRDWHTMDFPF